MTVTDPHEHLTEWGHRAEHAVEAVRELTARKGFGPNYNMLVGSISLTAGILCGCAVERARRAGLIKPRGPGFGGCREGGYVALSAVSTNLSGVAVADALGMDTTPLFAEPEREVLRPAIALPQSREVEPAPAFEAVPLPGLPIPTKAEAVTTAAQADKDARPKWASHSGRRLACDECLVFLHENGGKGPFPRSVRRVRIVHATGERLRLCKEHAEPREAADKAVVQQ